MSAAVLPPLLALDTPPRKRFTRAEFEQILETEAFSGKRFELIDGDLIDKIGQKPPHANSIRRLTPLLAAWFGLERIQVQSPIEVATRDRERNFPEPDLAVLKENKLDYDIRHPRGNELLVIVEVAESSLSRDTTTKRDLYARAGVPEYWVLDLEARRVVVHRAPAEGQYTQISEINDTESLTFESHSVPVAQLLP